MKRMIEQERAAYCLKFIQDYALETKDKQSKLATHIQKAPIWILQNGLGQMLAFLLADNEEASSCLYRCLEAWLNGSDGNSRAIYDKNEELIVQLTKGSRQDYMRAQEETLALFTWLKKFADAWLTKGEG